MLEKANALHYNVKMTCLDMLATVGHLLRKFEQEIDFLKIYSIVEYLYCGDNNRLAFNPQEAGLYGFLQNGSRGHKALRKRNYSFKTQTILLVLLIAIPLMIIILAFNIYTVRRSNQRVQESAMNTISLYKNSLESELRNVESLMISLVASDPSYTQLRYNLDPYRVYSNVYDIMGKYQNYMTTYSVIGAMHLYSEVNGIYRTEYRGAYNYSYKQQLAAVIEDLLEGPENPTQLGWFYRTIEDREFLMRAIGKDGLFTVCIVDPEKVPVPQSLGSADGHVYEGGLLVYASAQGTPVIMKDFFGTQSIVNEPGESGFFRTQAGIQYAVSIDYSEYASTKLYYLQVSGGVLNNLDSIQLLLLIFSVLLSFLLPVVLMTMQRKSFRPMLHLISTMEQIRAGRLDAKMDADYSIAEYSRLSTTFNELMGEIQCLKIEAYEKELAEQKTRLLLLQSQIRPHFYLNCLKNIQALAQQRQFDSIQSMVLGLSHYLRYLFQDGISMVTLADELKSVENYIALQSINSLRPTQCHIQVADNLTGIPIPPLSVLTFVENAVKHAALPDRTLNIRIKAVLLQSEDGYYLNLTITDNGGGFSPQILKNLNQRSAYLESGHIGIVNVKSRFELIYGNRSSLAFANLGEGSCIDIFIPLTIQEYKNIKGVDR